MARTRQAGCDTSMSRVLIAVIPTIISTVTDVGFEHAGAVVTLEVAGLACHLPAGLGLIGVVVTISRS